MKIMHYNAFTRNHQFVKNRNLLNNPLVGDSRYRYTRKSSSQLAICSKISRLALCMSMKLCSHIMESWCETNYSGFVSWKIENYIVFLFNNIIFLKNIQILYETFEKFTEPWAMITFYVMTCRFLFSIELLYRA